MMCRGSRRGSAALIIASLAVPATAAAAGPAPIDLKTRGAAAGINDSGQIVGAGNYEGALPWLTKQGAGTTSLPLGGWPSAINDSGMVVGFGDICCAFVWTPAGGEVRLATLGSPSYNYAWAYDVNNRSEVVGKARDRYMTMVTDRAVKWTPEGFMVDLGTLPKTGSAMAVAINDNGDVVGTSGELGSTSQGGRAFLWTQAGGMVEIPMLPGMKQSHAVDINDSGQVVGWSVGDLDTPHAFLWTQAGGTVDLGTLPGKGSASASGINDQGQIVGASGGQPFVWSATTGMVPLDLLPGDTQGSANQINDQGQIIGSSGTATTSHAVLWGGDTTKPTATIKPVRGVKLADVRSRGLRLQLTVSEPGSTALTLTRGKTKLATKTVNVTKAGTIAVTFKLSHNARVALRRPSKATFTVNTAARDLAGNSDVTDTKLTITR